MTNSNAVPKQLKPFQPGDPRINRKGRPKTADALKALILSVLDEPAYVDDKPVIIAGHHATRGEMMLREMINSRKPQDRQQILDRAYGKVPNNVNLGGPDGGQLTVVTSVVHKRVDDGEGNSDDAQG